MKKKIDNPHKKRDFNIITNQPMQKNQAPNIEETKHQSANSNNQYGNNQNMNFDRNANNNNNNSNNNNKNGHRPNSNPINQMTNVKNAIVPDRLKMQLPNANTFQWDAISKIFQLLSLGIPQSELVFNMNELYSFGYGSPLNHTFMNLIAELERDPNVHKKIFLILPFMAKMALNLPTIFDQKNELKCLVQNTSDSVTLTKAQICCLLAHMFFGSFWNWNNWNTQRGNPKIQEILNFQNLLCFQDSVNAHKMFCIFNYFEKMMNIESLNPEKFCQKVEFVRKAENSPRTIEKWLQSNKKLTNVKIYESGVMEDFTPPKSMHVDFANKFIGGGALTRGAVQEEIRFFMSPECLCSLLIFESFEDNEIGYITGTEKINKIEGYSQNMRFAGDYDKKNYENPMDDTILVLDAIHFKNPRDQYAEHHILRELNKAFLGFDYSEKEKENIITGKWGCGAFKGDPQLKFVIQWLACSEAEKEMHFCSFGEKTLKDAEKYVKFLSESGKKVKDIVDQILRFKENGILDLFDFLGSC